MNYRNENDVLTINIEGNIDTTNAEQIGAEIDEIRNNNQYSTLVLDADNLKYISSAGLRQILKLKKQNNDFRIINCSSEIYDIFEMTGFAEIMNVQKGYRKISVDGCEVIGEGSNGIVYRLNPDTIIKVYKNNDALEDIKRERELAKTALVLGINTAIPFDVVKVEDKYGSVFELLSAKSITKLINNDPENIDTYLKVFADLLKEINNTEVKQDLLPDARVKYLSYCEYLEKYLPEKTYKKLHRMFEEIPCDTHMIHGDYHTNNVHYDGKETILIDMDTLAIGNPVFDLSNFYLTYQGFGSVNHSKIVDFMKIDWDKCCYIWNKTMELYFEGLTSSETETAKNKAMLVGFTRLARRTIKREPDNKELSDYCLKQIIELTDKLESLEI